MLVRVVSRRIPNRLFQLLRRRLTATHRRPPSFGLASLRHYFFQTVGLISESKLWCQVGSILDLVWFRILRLFGLMFDFFLDHLGFPGPDSISGNLVFLGFDVGRSGAPFWKPRDVKMFDFEGLGLTSGSIFGDF